MGKIAHEFHGLGVPVVSDRTPSGLGGLLGHNLVSTCTEKETKEQHPEAHSAAQEADETNYFKMYDEGGC
jgi:hypothetical protein